MTLKFDAMLPAQPLRQAGELGRRAAAAGLSGLVVTEAGRTAYLTCGAIAVAAEIDVLTGIAVAFPRSPMVTASTAWELAEASGGRFRLGLGAQVRAHIERRYGAAFDPPGPRLREYVLAVKQIFQSFRTGEPLSVEGEFYALSLLPPTWAPGPIEHPDPPIDVAPVSVTRNGACLDEYIRSASWVTAHGPRTTQPVWPSSTASGAPPESPATTGSPVAEAAR